MHKIAFFMHTFKFNTNVMFSGTVVKKISKEIFSGNNKIFRSDTKISFGTFCINPNHFTNETKFLQPKFIFILENRVNKKNIFL